MAHPAPRRRCTAGNETNRRLVAAFFCLVLEKLSRVLLRRTADFSDHNQSLGLFVGEKHLEDRDEIGAFDRISADADRRRLAKTLLGGLEHRLVSQGARARDDTDFAALENI